ncbi:MAG: lipid-A-disaccharide synthase [Planctomycetota bacterium]|jgi:lipid-A-disaccharide synthase|nr:MAG: lipid-A-disaccharide synthase [Planctomycetota bacterium]
MLNVKYSAWAARAPRSFFMRVFISAGEPSGDHHAALLVHAIHARRPDAECIGLGGPQMATAGCRLVADLTQLAVMWFLRAILNIHRFIDMARRAERSFIDARPDVCVLVDFPGFHWWLAWRAKRHGIPVVFYCPPQVWAWGSWRVGKMRRLVDHVLSALPFEHDWFSARGMRSTLVGHPFFDEFGAAAAHRGMAGQEADPLVLLLPGSRGQEIEGVLGTLVRAASEIHKRVPRTRFVIGALHDRHARHMADVLRSSVGADGPVIEIHAGRTRSLIGEATAAIACSGSVSLELMSARVPTVIVYRISGFAYIVQSFFRHARFITLVNLLAVRAPVGPVRPQWWPPREVAAADPEAVYPEYLAVQDPALPAAGHVITWLEDPLARDRVVARLEVLARDIARPGSAARAAAAVLAIVAARAAPSAPLTESQAA